MTHAKVPHLQSLLPATFGDGYFASLCEYLAAGKRGKKKTEFSVGVPRRATRRLYV